MPLLPSSRLTALLGGALAILTVSSCTLPPSQAWQQIRQDGLVPFIANGMSAPRAQSNLVPSQQLLAHGQNKPVTPPPWPRIQPIAPIQTPVKPTATPPPAIAVKGLKGYVRTPFTNPARLVDVRGMSAGSKVVCPYTQRSFLVPSAAVVANNPAPSPSPALAEHQQPRRPRPSSSPATSRPSPTPQPSDSVAKIPLTPEGETAPVKSTVPTPNVAAPSPAQDLKPNATPAPSQQAISSAVEKPKETVPVASLPFGSPIPGRPGFVNSPHAEKHQLVDVTGLSIGTEVKCPYTGKRFRVPPQEQAKK